MRPNPFIGQGARGPRATRGWFPRNRRKRVYLANNIARPLNLLVFSRSSTTVNLHWQDVASGETGFEIERALGQASFSNITTTAAGIETFEDTGLSTGTLYRYRVRTVNSSGNSAYSEIQTVVTHTCPTDGPFHKELVLPRFTDAPEDWRVLLNEMAAKIEGQWNEQVATSPTCEICPTNGAVEIDCSRCSNFRIVTGSDINSISVHHCGEEKTVTVEILNPGPNDITVCGWPADFSCNPAAADHNPTVPCCETIPAGSVGGGGFHCAAGICITNTPAPVTQLGSGSALTLLCEALLDDETYVDVDSIDCELMDCSSGGDQRVRYKVTGGVPPYTWSITTAKDAANPPDLDTSQGGDKVTVSPSGTSSGSNTAYTRQSIEWTNASGPCRVCNNQGSRTYTCSGTGGNCGASSCCSQGGGDPVCANADPTCRQPGSGCSGFSDCEAEIILNCGESANANVMTCDCRSQSDKDSGTCEPCGLNMEGDGEPVLLTVTDAAGNNISVTVLMTHLETS